ncbi:tRNA dihydrouridine synthase DusB [Exilibacterium tricleocarpae]|uniref:tRNA-dihydrouridine synthase B n=1 Tax=Exilibacterium tricleocarpae TaxID=2591008 RepID=A0A545T3E8_9GAMM|nr:tRNA dihydrouridine synthase DusB [Exilibacterium tricleocarpae]TQV71730.1 tRNA dihydrouridine synthase DusB [Exilibacterium tricleocarpae]
MFHIGPYRIDSRAVLAPMAGITDSPFRQLCRRLGAGLVVSEMLTADTGLWHSRKSNWRLRSDGEMQPRSIQIAGATPQMLAQAAQAVLQHGAQIIDINMGCPAKKVCNKAAGSALLRDEQLVAQILNAVVGAVDVPVTLKIRTGWSPEVRNATRIARIAEDAGIAALAVHGRTRACRFQGRAEYDTIAAVVDAVSIPVFANGDIATPVDARRVLDYTGAAAVMIGRAAQGRPWIFREIDTYLRTGSLPSPPPLGEVRDVLLDHLHQLHRFYGDYMGVRIARKHLGWYLKTLASGGQFTNNFKKTFNQLETAEEQHASVQLLFERLNTEEDKAA